MNPKVQRAFDRSAKRYDQYALQQREVLHHAVNRARHHLTDNAKLLDAGCGTGYLACHARSENIGWDIHGIDQSEAMCKQASRHCPVTHAAVESLPFEPESYDAWFSSLVLQWVQNPATAFTEAARILKPKGHAIFTCYVEGTLEELSTSFSTLHFHTQSSLLTAARQAGLTILETERTNRREHYINLPALLARIKGVGASTAIPRSQRGLMTPRRYAHLEAAYERDHMSEQGITASWHILTCVAQKA